MLLQIFGILDIITGILFFINNTFDKSGSNWFPNRIIIIAGIYLLVKGLIFVILLDFASAIDIIAAVIILISVLVHIPVILTAIVLLFLIQKGIFSLAS
jgi:hypothetical protein